MIKLIKKTSAIHETVGNYNFKAENWPFDPCVQKKKCGLGINNLNLF